MKKSGKSGTFKNIRLAVFCGNPGNEYRLTRHNAGRLLLEAAEKIFHTLPGAALSGWQKKFKGEYAKADFESGSVIFLKPETFMNLTGESVLSAANFFKIQPEEIMVCHDDIELDYGTVSVKFGGGAAGHNGLRSIDKTLGTGSYFRYRIGISRPKGIPVDSHVLGRFSRDEEIVLEDYMRLAGNYLLEILSSGSEPAAGSKITLIT